MLSTFQVYINAGPVSLASLVDLTRRSSCSLRQSSIAPSMTARLSIQVGPFQLSTWLHPGKIEQATEPEGRTAPGWALHVQ